MHRRVTPRAPARAQAQLGAMRFFADKNQARACPCSWPCSLRMALQTKIIVPFHKHLGINRAVGIVTDGASLAQGLMFVNEWPGLLAMAGGACFVQACHGQAARGLADVHAMRVMTLRAVHFAFDHRMMLGEVELGMGLQMAGKTCRRILAGIDNEFASAAPHGDVFAARTMAGFTPGRAFHSRPCKIKARVRAGWKPPADVCMAVETGGVAYDCGSFDRGRGHHGPFEA